MPRVLILPFCLTSPALAINHPAAPPPSPFSPPLAHSTLPTTITSWLSPEYSENTSLRIIVAFSFASHRRHPSETHSSATATTPQGRGAGARHILAGHGRDVRAESMTETQCPRRGAPQGWLGVRFLTFCRLFVRITRGLLTPVVLVVIPMLRHM